MIQSLKAWFRGLFAPRAQAKGMYGEPTFAQVQELIAAAKGEEYVPPKGASLYAKPTFSQFQELIGAVKASSSGSAAAVTSVKVGSKSVSPADGVLTLPVTDSATSSDGDTLASAKAVRSAVDTATTALTNAFSQAVTGASYSESYAQLDNKPAILLKHGDTVLAAVDASAFIVDGMVEDVYIGNATSGPEDDPDESGKLVVKFNTDAGSKVISIPLTDIFNPDNYPTKDDVNAAMGALPRVWSGDTSVPNRFVNGNRQLCEVAYTWTRATDDSGESTVFAYSGSTIVSGSPRHTWTGGGTTLTYYPTSGTIFSGNTKIYDSDEEGAVDIRNKDPYRYTFPTFGKNNKTFSYNRPGDESVKVIGKLALSSEVPDVSGKADRAANPTSGNLAALDASGNPTDSLKSPSDFLEYGVDSDNEKTAATIGIQRGQGTVGKMSFVQGYLCVAEGNASHAQGDRTTAKDTAAHAEGSQTEATAAAAHAEGGSTKARGTASHSEGLYSKATGIGAHAEGSSVDGLAQGVDGTDASGSFSHTEGLMNAASGMASHAQGFRSSDAGKDFSFVWQGYGGDVPTPAQMADLIANGPTSPTGGAQAIQILASAIQETTVYNAKHKGSFCINPVPANGSTDPKSGFFVGTESFADALKVQRIYNEARTDALDDKGRLFGSIVYEAKYTVTGSGYGDGDFVYSGCDDGHVYRFALTSDSRQEIRYDSDNGKLYTAYHRSTGWFLTDLRTVDSGLNPGRGDVLPGYSNGWYAINQVGANGASVVYTPRSSDFATTPYARFAIEFMPTAWVANTTYDVGVCAAYDGKAYRCTAEHTSGSTFDASKWVEIPVLTQKANRAANPTEGNLAELDSQGNLVDSGKKPTDFATTAQGQKADTALQGVKVGSLPVTPDSNRVVSLGTAAAKNVPASGDALPTQVVMGNDSRLPKAENSVQRLPDNATPSAKTAVTIGTRSTADAADRGQASLAVGDHLKASGPNAVATGTWTQATAQDAHAEGNSSQATNNGAHAEGNNTRATGAYSHAEGTDTVASGLVSHAEGNYATAEGTGAHAEGMFSKASGVAAHAEGSNLDRLAALLQAAGTDEQIVTLFTQAATDAAGSFSHTEGLVSSTSQMGSHSQGFRASDGGNPFSFVWQGYNGPVPTAEQMQALLNDPTSEDAQAALACLVTALTARAAYASKGPGTFCINPVPQGGSGDPKSGFFVGGESLAAALKVPRIYNEMKTDALDDKGSLRTGTVQQSYWTAKVSGSADVVYDYMGYVNNAGNAGIDGMAPGTYVYAWNRHGYQANTLDRIFYNPDTGKVYSVYMDGADGWRTKYEVLSTQATGLNPGSVGGVLDSVSDAKVSGRTVQLVFSPTAVVMSQTPYTQLALESVPTRTIAGSYAYAVGDLLGDGGKAYRCKSAYTSAATPVAPSSDTTHWTEVPTLAGLLDRIAALEAQLAG